MDFDPNDYTPKSVHVLEAMKVGLESGTWTFVSRRFEIYIFRYSETLDTPKSNLGHGFNRWPDETYTRHVFVDLMIREGKRLRSVKSTLAVAHAPWVGTNNHGDLSMNRAIEVIGNPAALFAPRKMA